MIFRLGLTGHRSRQYCGAALALSLLLAGGGSEYALAQAATTSTSPATTVSISLNDAIQRAQANEPAFAAIAAETKATQLDRSIAKRSEEHTSELQSRRDL